MEGMFFLFFFSNFETLVKGHGFAIDCYETFLPATWRARENALFKNLIYFWLQNGAQ